MNIKDNQGILGEAKALVYFIENGYTVFTQFDGKAPFDMVVYKDNILYRVSVKSTRTKTNSGKYIVTIASMRHNRTKNITKYFDPQSCDILAIYIVPEDRIVIIESKDIVNKKSMRV